MDLEQLRAEPMLDRLPSKPRHKSPRGWFLKGPIPGAWLEAAGRLPGKCLHVGLAIWHVKAMRREIRVTRGLLDRFGVKAGAGRWALAKLQAAGLVTVERKPGCSPVVTILETNSGDGQPPAPP